MEKIFNKVMKVISCFLLSIFVISSVWGGVQATSDDSREYTEWTDNSEAICIAYSETPDSCLGESHAAATAETSLKGNLDVLGLGIMGTGWLGAEAEDKISTVKPELIARIGNGVVGTLDNGLKTALYSYPGDVTMYNAIYQDWSPSRMNQAEAASSGTVILSPVRKLFEYVRGIAYVCSVLVIVVIAFMIMFRQKVGGQVAVTITNALPRVLIGFILIHFSFWIASVILSFSTFLMAIAEVAISNAIVDISGFSDVQTIGLGGPVHLWWNIFHWVLGPTAVKDSTSGIGGWVGGLFGVNPVRSFFESKASLSTIPTVARSMWSMGVDLSIGGIIVKLVFAVGLIFAVFKIFFNLIKAYAQIFLKVIVLPITTLMGMFPGQEKSIIESYKSILVDSLVFPVTFIIINLAVLISIAGNPALGGSAIGFPSGLKTSLVDPNETNLTGFIAYGMILAATTAEKLIAEIIKYQESKAQQIAAGAIMGTTQKVPFFGTLIKE